MKRYYIATSSVFDGYATMYRSAVYIDILKCNRAKYVRMAYCYGWHNQPKVVCFNAADETLLDIELALKACPEFSVYGPIIHEKDW